MTQKFPADEIRKYRVQGNAAYDVLAPKRKPVELPEEKPVPRPARQPQKSPQIALFTVFGIAVVAFLGVLIIFGYVRIYETDAQATALRQQIAALEQEQARLQQNYDSSIDLVAVREQAQALGMREPRPDQIVYLHLSGTDHAEIMPAGSARGSLLTVLQEFFLGILE